MPQEYNENILRVLRLTREMIIIADEGDDKRQDPGCGILYGMVRDTAYKLRSLAEKEKNAHLKQGIWDIGTASNNKK